jgi:hypothetical protein
MAGWSASTDQGRGQLWQYRRGQHVATLGLRTLEAGAGHELVLTLDATVIRATRYGTSDQEALAAELARALEEGRQLCDSLVSVKPA